MTTPQLPLPDPGAIHVAYLRWRLADGTDRGEWRRVLILDAGRDGDDVVVLWCPQQIHDPASPEQELPANTAYEHRFAPLGSWVSATDGADATVVSITLRQQVGTYVPRDPAGNSVNILASAARGMRERQPAADNTQVAVTGTVAQLRRAQAEVAAQQDQLALDIRAALGAGHSVAEVAGWTQLSRERIYQIRDGRR